MIQTVEERRWALVVLDLSVRCIVSEASLDTEGGNSKSVVSPQNSELATLAF